MMAARRRITEGLTDEEIARLRSQLDEGRRPRVRLSGPQFPAGSSGAVVRIGDPAVEGADYVTVRVKLNGVTDELAFAPPELSVRAPEQPATSAKRAGRAAPRRPAAAASAGPSGSEPAASAPQAPAALPAPDARPVPAAPPARTGEGGTVAQPVAAAPGSQRAASRRRKPAPAPKVSLTISSSEASWSLSASRGAKAILKNTPIPPGVVTAIARLIDQAVLTESVAEINETAIAEARSRAEQLRAELSTLEAVLATHESPN
jgi:hypothetical protein